MSATTETFKTYSADDLDADAQAAAEPVMTVDPEITTPVAEHIDERDTVQTESPATSDDAPTSVPRVVVTGVADQAQPAHRWSLPHWGALAAASALLGVLVGYIAFDRKPELFVAEHGRMTAHSDLDAALSQQIGGTIDRETGIKVGVSYREKSGDYCRTFTVSKTYTLAGLACRRDSQWAIDAVTRANANSTGAYRMAGVEVPALILGIVENTISGEPLDAEQEAERRTQGWTR